MRARRAPRVQHQVAERQHRGFRRVAARQRADARHQFGRGEGLDQVIVGAGLQPAYAVLDGIARGQQQYRGGVAARPQAAHDFEAVDAGQADVEYRHQRRITLQEQVGLEAVARQLDLHALALQGTDQAIGKDGVVFDK